MSQLQPHITFHGLCREALDFYKRALNGDVAMLQTFNDSPVEFQQHILDRVMHAEFVSAEVSFFASDGLDGSLAQGSGDVALYVRFDDEKRQSQVFSALSDQGVVVMPLDYTFWNVRFGILTDRFGIRWMLSCPMKASE
ncbi:VOC family protein [Enterovibrio nigricans]|uniref:PhnB protein n=1 Tax=Enterovibrio nigricans DSM 22720 TaxID=1121868 RepID=A0A1T4USV7_9GAMM|nr:VOC family protein [Enterovibrio nigricans]PKF50800.1 VOC family protein [Enterovibrio nigricans]SKA55753.1 PhnB protein [Enterovibrio nigricans DSM 22720]